MDNVEPPVPATTFCSQCGRVLPPAEVVTLAGTVVCAACKPALIRRLQEGTATTALVYKGFWIRLVAKIVDGCILSVVLGPLYFVLVWGYMRASITAAAAGRQPDPTLIFSYLGQIAMFEVIAVFLFWLYNTVMLGQFQATLGKMAIGARVVRPDGSRISWGQAAGRSGMEIVSSIIFDIGYIIAAFDSEKRALHDMVASTRVVAR